MGWELQPITRLEWSGSLSVFVPRFAFTPITIGRTRYELGPKYIEWRSLYVFGVRIARWSIT